MLSKTKHLYRALLTGSLVALALFTSQCKNQNEATKEEQNKTIKELVRDEEAVLEITILTSKIGQSLKNKAIINLESRSLFTNEIELIDLLSPKNQQEAKPLPHGITKNDWLMAKPKTLTLDDAQKQGIWKEVIQNFDQVSHASFGFLSGESHGEDLFHSILKLNAKGTSKDLTQFSLSAKIAVDWIQSEDSWKIKKWHTKSLKIRHSQELMFKNHMAELFSARNLQLATRSRHEELLTEFIRTNETVLPPGGYGPYFQPESGYQHPAVSVVDINLDGWDDLFVTSLWAPCQLWINERGRNFTEQAQRYGLDVRACCTSAIFTDLDNDGDPDLILGRSLERSQLFWNEEKSFSASPIELPYLVTSVSVADCNKDGLLDIYLCTYGPSGTAAQGNPEWLNRFLPTDSHSSYKAALAKGHRYYDQAGPRNYLLLNRGERTFETAPPHPSIDQYHNSYQGSWSDYDKDGDADLYICNDFAPDALLRNDGLDDKGVPRFTDLSKDLSGDTMKGFGMGASWGDFDNDLIPDLFVTNMYSKAGKRVLSRFDNIDDRLHFSARGNLLFKQGGGEFQQLAGENDAFPVHLGGWAFGGQFIDVDNDAWLDLYVPNGFYTAPKSVASEVDL
ncbi:VCBS repeat-containing protein [Akkermansiaceae bacterium]|nr:VCBS repeat-containing protein [Akkermansiaceae bacterium]